MNMFEDFERYLYESNFGEDVAELTEARLAKLSSNKLSGTQLVLISDCVSRLMLSRFYDWLIQTGQIHRPQPKHHHQLPD